MTCYICNNRLNNTRVLAREMFLGSREIFPYIQCSSCRSLSIENIPGNLEELYARYPGLQHPQSKDSRLRTFLKRYMLKHSNCLARKIADSLATVDDLRLKALYNCLITPDIRLLDVGTGSGWFVYELHRLGYKNIMGIEPSLNQDVILDNGVRLYKKTLYELDQQFDFITFHHSFEHVENPIEVLKKTASLLTKEGTCLIRLPNVDSWAFRFFKEHWSGIHAPYHLFLPSKKGMEILCAAAGFKIVDIRYEQLVESFLRSTCYSLDFASHDEFGSRTILQGRPLKNRKIPLFTKREIAFLKEKAKKVLKDRLAGDIAYYLKKID